MIAERMAADLEVVSAVSRANAASDSSSRITATVFRFGRRCILGYSSTMIIASLSQESHGDLRRDAGFYGSDKYLEAMSPGEDA
ncbi:hypothetical protein [Microbacterium paraoxydans]|uniref:hypothetical protein n=1 Tax=Microbacterium paraoxydans TaxID=199592 RepID=UPI001CF982EE|nr:hypothetical protein [Microbacterium paraoxydans]